ncbi:MAG: Metalloprotease PmbA [Alphaproteobacteria bacterium MarineAlpha9_Bin4]|nr:MAG: Metalloprotease PmbA [Alphaproteobacteria bacterium MarineAlpha9_Bin4]
MKKNSIENFCEEIKDNYKKKGIDDFELSISDSTVLSAQTRNVKLENIESSSGIGITLDIIIGKKQATLSANNIEGLDIREFLEKGKFMAKASPEDPYAGLPETTEYADRIKDLDLEDKNELDNKKLINLALQAEEEMLNVSKVTNTEGGSASTSKSKITFLSSKGFFGSYNKTFHSVSSIAIAGRKISMQRDYDYSTAVHLEDLKNPTEIGKNAGERAVARLNSRKIKSSTVDVIFEPRIAKSLLSSFASCISGTSIARGTSFLSKKINRKICRENITISNMPLLSRGLGSAPFDARGIKSKNIKLVENGYFRNYLLGLRSSRQLNLKPNGNSSPYNLTLSEGKDSADDIIKSIKKGFYVTEMLGMSFNTVNGDYSRGAAGFMIENGEISFPVNEVTIAGNMNDILEKIIPAKDLKISENINSPTILVEKMSLAGI